MRLFLSLMSFVCITLAKPQYNYGNGVSGSFGTSSNNNLGGGIDIRGNFASGNVNPSHNSHASHASHSSHSTHSAGFNSNNNNFQSSYNQFAHTGSSNVNQQHGQFEAPLVHKQFISIAGPEDHDNLEQNKHLVIGRPQKNYRVVFIKAPSSSSANVKLSAEYAPKEEKTVIYVLSKKDNQLEVSDIATPAPTVPSKPEIFFIKYKTEEEAHHAQKQIQAEYDRIEGSSEHTDAGVAQVQSVIGILGNGNAGGSSSSGFSSSSGGSSSSYGGSGSTSSFNSNKNSAYLPPSV